MKHKIVSFEIAKLAKELGFDDECYYYWEEKNGKVNTMNDGVGLMSNKDLQGCEFYYTAPTLAHLQEWLREKSYMVWVEPFYYDGWNYMCKVSYPNGFHEVVGQEHGTWNEQLEEGLLTALKKMSEELVQQ